MRIPLVRTKENILKSCRRVRRDKAPADAGVVRHQHCAGFDAPICLKFALRVGTAKEFLEAINLRMIARTRNSHIKPSTPKFIRHHLPRRLCAFIKRIVSPEPRTFHNIPKCAWIGIARVIRNQVPRFVQPHNTPVALDVLRIMKPDIRMRRLHRVESPFTNRREPRWKCIRRDK